MPGEDGAAIRWRLQAAERALELLGERKADNKDLNAIGEQVRASRVEMGEQFAVVNQRIDRQNQDREEDRKQSSRDKRQMIYVFSGFGVTIVTALIASGHLG